MDTNTKLQVKLRQRRKAMNITLHTSSMAPDQTQISEDDEEDSAQIIGDSTEDLGETEANNLQEHLESHHDKIKKRLETSEVQSIKSEDAERLDYGFPSSITPAMSKRRSQEFKSPRSDVTSTLGTALGTHGSGQHMSLRSRLQEKLKAAKEQRGLSASGDKSHARTKRLRERISFTTSRFSDPLHLLGRPDLEKEKELDSRVTAKLQWKTVAEKARKKLGQHEEADCYDFFTKQYEDASVSHQERSDLESERVIEAAQDVIEAAEPLPEGPSFEAEEEPSHEYGEEKKLLEEIVPSELDWKLFTLTAAEYMSYRSRMEVDKQVHFIPSMFDAPAASKVLDDTQPVYLEEEGFYVGLLPEVQRRNKNILENRILRQSSEGKSWFGMDGIVKLLPNPVQTTTTKPWAYTLDDTDSFTTVGYVKAHRATVESKYIQDAEEHELQLNLGTVLFHHHPYMSREHVLASRLSELYDQYVRQRHKNYTVFYNEKLRTLRLAVETMRTNSVSTDTFDDMFITDSVELRIQDYISEIGRTCRQRDSAEAYERDLLRHIYSEWSEIKSLRITQGFSNTSMKLTIKRQEVNHDSDRQAWMEETEQQLKECFEEYEYSVQYPFRKRMVEYQRNVQKWKKAMLRQKKQLVKAGKDEIGLDTPETDGEETPVALARSPRPLEPVPPDKFDEAAVRDDLIHRALQCRRNPGEPKISLEVTHTGPVTPDSQVPAGEMSRRTALQNASLFAKVRFNGREVCTSDRKTLTSDFKAHFGQIFKIRIAQWPDSLKVLLYEGGLMSSPLLAEIDFCIPDGSVNCDNCQLFPASFTSDKAVTCSHEGVGSSTPFTLRSDATASTSLKTRGQLLVSIAWGINDGGKILAPKLLTQGLDALEMAEKPFMTSNRSLHSYGLQDSDMMALWSQEGKLDPNDPVNAGVLPYANAREGLLPAADYYTLDQVQKEFNFASYEEIDRARRFRILDSRNKGIPEFRNLRMVPANEHEIFDSAFIAHERRKRDKDALGEMGEKKVVAGTLSAHRLEVLRFRQRVQDSVFQRFFAARRYRTLKDMVHEEQVPDIGTLGTSILKSVEPRRPLKPVRSERKKATAQNLPEGSVSVLVTVVRAYNLPMRDNLPSSVVEGTLSRAVLGTSSQHFHEDGEAQNLSPFISVSFQGNVKTTNTAQGPNPCWNEELQLPFSAASADYAPENLQTIDDILFINVFDRVVHDASIDDRNRNDVGEISGVTTGVVSHKIQNHWLGSLKVPFSTIYQQGKIDGTFKLSVPILMLGYAHDKTPALPGDPYNQMESQFLQPSDGSYVNVFITLEPALARPEPVQQKFETQEDRRQIAESLRFMEECRKKFPKRTFKTTVIDMKGESVLITRFIKPLQPPAVLSDNSSRASLITAEKLARYVSLIPSVSDSVIYAGVCDLWSTCDQFLNMLCGDEEEHAILLLNYFLSVGKSAYLVLGNAIPEGETAYVLTLEQSQEYFLWNASTGQHYKTTNSLCPLQSVHALVNQDNLWFNVQHHDIPSRVDFNIHSGWRSLLKSSETRLTSVQPDFLVYPGTDLTYVHNLEERIERSLKDAIMSWRPRHITRWNRSCSSALLQILQGLENERWITMTHGEEAPSRRSLQNDHTDHLSRLIGDARFVGFPMDMPFTDIDAVIESVRSTEVHKIQDDDLEFALAVHIHPYPASVLCVWVYVGVLNSKRAV